MNSTNERVPWHPNMPIVVQLVHNLYAINGCSCGGLAHVVLDDGNISMKDLDFTINFCDRPENLDRPERHLVKCIMEYMKEMTIKQRHLMFKFANDMDGYVSDAIYFDEEIWNQWYDLYEDYINETMLSELKEYCERMGCLNELEET